MVVRRHSVPQAAANRARVLRLLRRHHRLSRSEIAQRAGLSEASVSRIISELAHRQLVVEEGLGRSTGGRPAVHLRLDTEHHRAVGVDIHTWETRVSLGALNGRILDSAFFRTPADPAEALDAVAGQIETLLADSGGRRVEGIGVSVRGLINSRDGVVEHGNDEHWMKVPARERLEARLQLPVYVENNVRAAAYAEYHYGSPDVRDAHCLLFVKIDEGLGVSMMLEGELFYGQHMAAGEFGQMVIDDQEGSARHDRPGCLEKLANDTAICERYRSQNGTGRAAAGGDVTTRAKQICHLALSGDQAAVKALKETARYLGVGISNIVWGLDPDAVIIDGTLTEAWPLVDTVIRDQFADGREFLNFRNLLLRPSALEGRAAITGAAALSFRSLFAKAQHARV
jgi:predicted NBD/HSP70 family sugar kinase